VRRDMKAIVAICVACTACASLWATPQAADLTAQEACIAEAGTRAQADACRCRVMALYDAGPQCGAEGGLPQ
jgi:hypothetical protein